MLNAHYPGLPDYVGPTQGWFLLLHHDVAVEWSDNVMERVRYIAAHKPLHEHAMRLRCIYAVEETRVPLAYRQVFAAHRQAGAAYRQTWFAHRKTWLAYEQAWAACLQAGVAHEPELTALIQACVPDAPWDGTRLVFNVPEEVDT